MVSGSVMQYYEAIPPAGVDQREECAPSKGDGSKPSFPTSLYVRMGRWGLAVRIWPALNGILGLTIQRPRDLGICSKYDRTNEGGKGKA